MNNMRRGFTLIELIFVIVIIGILAAVALPKFLETADQATLAKLKAYAGTLSRTTIPPIWSKSIDEDNNGSIVLYGTNIVNTLEAPREMTTGPAFLATNLEDPGYVFVNGTGPDNIVGSASIGVITYSVVCSDGNLTESAKCNVWNPDDITGSGVWLIKY